MSLVQFIDHHGTRILMLDFSGVADPKTLVSSIDEAERVIAGEPERSVLTLTYVRGSNFSADLGQRLWRFARHNKPYVKAGAIVGLGALQKELYHLVMNLSRRNLPPFDDLEVAKDWLVSQAEDG